MDESVVIELLLNKNSKDFPDVAVVVTDVENLKRNLLLFTQMRLGNSNSFGDQYV